VCTYQGQERWVDWRVTPCADVRTRFGLEATDDQEMGRDEMLRQMAQRVLRGDVRRYQAPESEAVSSQANL
jgi:hypothetical protein